jgi:hypothetical protein
MHKAIGLVFKVFAKQRLLKMYKNFRQVFGHLFLAFRFRVSVEMITQPAAVCTGYEV